MKWIALGTHVSDGTLEEIEFRSAGAATAYGRDRVRCNTWRSFRVAKVTAEYERGAVRVK